MSNPTEPKDPSTNPATDEQLSDDSLDAVSGGVIDNCTPIIRRPLPGGGPISLPGGPISLPEPYPGLPTS